MSEAEHEHPQCQTEALAAIDREVQAIAEAMRHADSEIAAHEAEIVRLQAEMAARRAAACSAAVAAACQRQQASPGIEARLEDLAQRIAEQTQRLAELQLMVEQMALSSQSGEDSGSETQEALIAWEAEIAQKDALIERLGNAIATMCRRIEELEERELLGEAPPPRASVPAKREGGRK